MIKKVFSFFMFVFFFCSAFALDCPNGDAKFIQWDFGQIKSDLYNKDLYANKLSKSNYTFLSEITGGKWAVGNKDSTELKVVGSALCLDGYDLVSFNNIKYGTYCWCKIDSVDNHDVLSPWSNVKNYDNHKFDKSRYPNLQEYIVQQKEKEKKEQNIQECMDNCASKCRAKIGSLIHEPKGYYDCGKAMYKLENVKCSVDKQFIKINKISVFEDFAEITSFGFTIILTRDKTNANGLIYVGEYENQQLFLKVQGNRIYIGREPYSYAMEECL